MALISILQAAPAVTLINLDYVPERILVGDITNQVVSNLSVSSRGQQLMSVTDAARIAAMSKLDMGAFLNATDLAPAWLRLAPLRLPQACTIQLQNAGATTPNVFAASTGMGNIARTAVEQSINPNANQSFEGFEALFFLPANVLRVNLVFANGFSDDYEPAEIAALFSASNVADANGLLEGHCVIKSDQPGDNDVVRATIYTTGVGNVVVLRTSYLTI